MLTVFLTAYFLFLCLLHFFSSRPLWLDEASLFASIKDFSYLQLFGPLQNCQVFPRIYLSAIKSFASWFDYSLLSLRFIPLACMFAAFFVWLRVYRKEPLALFSFSVSYWMIYYAAELKPYSMDLLAVGLFLLFLGHREGRKAVFFLPLLLFFSYAALFLFWVPAYNLIVLSRREKSALSSAIIYTSLSAAAAISVYLLDLRFGLSQGCLLGYWKDYFLCTDSPYCFLKSFSEGLRNIVAWPFGNSRLSLRLGSIFIPFFLLGMFLSFKSFLKEAKSGIHTLDALGAVMFIELCILGLFKKYPFTGERVTLFFMPVVFLMIVRGIGLFKQRKIIYLPLIAAYILFLGFCGWSSFSGYLKPYL